MLKSNLKYKKVENLEKICYNQKKNEGKRRYKYEDKFKKDNIINNDIYVCTSIF